MKFFLFYAMKIIIKNIWKLLIWKGKTILIEEFAEVKTM
ncbi:hypothetical protein QE441_001790 [Chryseobacterium sp. SORGH_AS909]|uniref:Uncharacterized protein n=1 Tax=Chryseobacterium camelliae TaxID=1265445 RepID=A0ABU0TNK8_9FLAO|nr:hypothetical protein [Chryseobacterium camelliae]MDQ1102562.1 hypothetical protein [Chryseobacterium sp. SORGH_AS_1048]MDR6085996.1 hypothetical protein [Chryseobacterium sp. SORGH_AS_0909]MDT3407509.1 hypothetical protein [Pseudacidovorax intermedius]